jgi:YD repeat-containing protein
MAKKGSARWLVGFTLLLCVTGAVPVLADPAPEDQGSTEASARLDPSLLPDAEDLAKAEEQLEEEEAERALELESPTAVAEREESALAYKDLESAGAVSDLLRSSFEDVLAILDQDPARALSDGSLKRNLRNDGGAVISDEGETELIEAEIPAEIPTEGGGLEKVDLTLDATAEGFEPENPITEVTIPTSPAEAISIDGGAVSITQVGADPESSAHLFGDKDVIYPEVQTDTDLLISPLSNGVELFDQLRSPQSPETLHFSLNLPEGAELKANAGAAEVYEGEKLIGLVSPPHAVDAQGTRVPVMMDVQGSSLVLSVPHRDAEYAYPILVDPEYTQNDWVNVSWVGGNRYDVLTDGTFLANWNNSKILTRDTCINACWGSGHGLHISVPSGNYNGGQWAQWTYTPPGETSYLNGYLVNPFWRYDAANQACWSDKHPEPHEYDGLWSPTYSIYYQLYTKRALNGNVAAIYGNTAQTAKVMVIGMSTGNSSSDPCWRDLYAGGVATYMTDPDWPTLDPVSGFPTGWFDNSKTYTVNVSAHDAGLGVRNIWLLPEGRPAKPLRPTDCYGTHDSPCYRDMSGPLEFNGNHFDEGRTSAKVTAQDALARAVNSGSWYAYADNLPPEVTLSGQLASVTAEGGSKEPTGEQQVERLSLPVYNLEVKAEDGVHDVNDPKKWRSGVKAIKVYLDGGQTPLQEWTQTCPGDSCSMTKTYALKLHELSSGEHKLKVIATDQLNHPRERVIEFEYVPATGMKDEYVMHYFPLPDGTGNEVEEEHPVRPELAVNVMNGNLVYREQDVEVPGYAVDLEVERYYNSMLPESENTEWGDGWTLGETPKLDPEEGGTPAKGDLLANSGLLKKDISLPTQAGTSQFDADLQTRVTKLSGGGYELTDESGESTTSAVLDPSGKTTELRTEGYARVDYEYETGELAEIEVEDPGSASDFAQVEEEEVEYVSPNPLYQSSFGTQGTGNGQLKSPGDVAVAANGDLWVVDRANNRIQRFSSSGTYISQFGSFGSGNGQFNRPTSIAIDTAGNLWVADANNNRIQKFSSSGTFVKTVGSLGTENGKFNAPEGIATDAKGNVWVADTMNRRIQKFNSEGTFQLKFGSQGSGNGQFGEANSIDIGPGGKIWVADWVNHRVQQFTEAGTYVQKFGSYGTGAGQFNHPDAVEVDSRGNVWVGDQSNNRVQQFTEAGTYVSQFGTSGPGEGQFSFTYPMAIAVDNKGGMWVTDVGNHRIQKWVLPAYRPKFNDAYGSAGGGDGQFGWAADVAVDSEGDIWVADNFGHRLQQFKPNGEFISKFGVNGTAAGQLNWPAAIAIDAQDNIWVADAVNRIQKFSPSGQYLGKIGSAGSGNGQFATYGPEGLAIDPKGNIWVSDTGAGRVQKFDSNGAFVKVVGSPGSGAGQFGRPTDIDFDTQGNAWIADRQNNRIAIFNENGTFIRQFGTTGSGEGQFKAPEALEIDANGTVWVADWENHRVQAFNEANEYLTQFGANGSEDSQLNLGHIMGIESDDYGRIWITDTHNSKLKKWKIPSWVIPQGEANDPAVEVQTNAGLVEGVEGEEAGEHSYEHEGDLLTAYEGPEGETSYEYDLAGRMTEVTLPNGTWAKITYNPTYGRVSTVEVKLAGAPSSKTTFFSYQDTPSRRTTVTPPGAPAVTYDIGEDGSVFRWQHASSPPEISLTGSIAPPEGEKATPISAGLHNLVITASSPHGIKSIQLIVNSDQLVDEKACEKEEPEICETVINEWVMETDNFPPGILSLEVIVENRIEKMASKRFWVNVPLPPPPPPDGVPTQPTYKDILSFRDEFGLEVVDPVEDETQLNDRIFESINAWLEGDPVARATTEKWGVPLRAKDAAELDYRQQYQEQAASAIPAWVQAHASSTYAGYYINEKAGGLIRVGFNGQQNSQVEALKAEAGLIAPSRFAGFTAPPTQSLSQLEGLQGAVNGSSSQAITRVGIDVKSNRVLVGSSNVSETTSQLTNELGSSAAFSVYYEPVGLVPRSPRERNFGAIIAGDSLTSPYFGPLACTAGYGAWENSPPKSNGEVVRRLFVLDVAHCFLDGEKVDRRDGNTHVRKFVGMTARDAYDYLGNGHNVNGWSTDASAIRVDSPELAPRQIWRYPLNATDVRMAAPVPEAGTWVCFSGQTSDRVICGPITVSEKVVFAFPGGNIGNQKLWLTCFKEPSIGGDSGGPVWIKGTHKAIGLVSAGDNDETCLTPLLPVQGHPQAPGVLAAPGMGSLNLLTRP